MVIFIWKFGWKLWKNSFATDDEMEEVPEKEGYEPVIPTHLRAEYGE